MQKVTTTSKLQRERVSERFLVPPKMRSSKNGWRLGHELQADAVEGGQASCSTTTTHSRLWMQLTRPRSIRRHMASASRLPTRTTIRMQQMTHEDFPRGDAHLELIYCQEQDFVDSDLCSATLPTPVATIPLPRVTTVRLRLADTSRMKQLPRNADANVEMGARRTRSVCGGLSPRDSLISSNTLVSRVFSV
ncbi:Aste57867_15988 [Aphanomyces stellatus]|uniref:Aste57867_15988 protein n=1 Tax=Aphanomyces stellatus TaxID=120398 RepID=A0A485L7K2_9STRA|nr:hypothetical protein As57867_015932 [Aphanomyces stellatus]VFT92773.1 Aste57867_15988 [Aphanomyces stellatus]